MLIALFKKDVRICRLPIIAGVVLLFGPFAMAWLIVSYMPLWNEATPATAWATFLGTGSYFSVMCSQPTLAMISGNIIAAERSDRSAEFLAYLPPSKAQVIGSKFFVLAMTVLVVWGLNLAVGAIAEWLAGETDAARTMTADLLPLRELATIGLVAVGSGWCASSVCSTTGPAVALAFTSPLMVLAVLTAIQYVAGWPSVHGFGSVYFPTCALLGATLFMIGTVYFLRRIEP